MLLDRYFETIDKLYEIRSKRRLRPYFRYRAYHKQRACGKRRRPDAL